MTGNGDFQKKVIIFLEHPDDVAIYLEKKRDIAGSHHLVATLPEVTWELEKKGVHFTGIESFYDPHMIYSKGLENYDIVETVCSSIDAVFQERDPLIKKYDFRPARDNFYFLKMLFDSLALRILQIQSIIANEKPDQVITFCSSMEYEARELQNFPFDYRERLYSLIFKTGKWNFDLTEVMYDRKVNHSKDNPEKSQSFTGQLSKRLKQYPLLFMPLLTVKKFGIYKAVMVLFFQVVNPIMGRKCLFLLRDDPSWSSIIPELYESGYHVKYLPEKKELLHPGPAIDDKLRNKVIALLQPYCSFCSVDFLDVAEARFLPVLSAYCNVLHQIVQDLEKRIIADNPVAFLCSEKSSFVEHIYAHIAQHHNIPVIAWQHGDGPFYPPMQVFVEIMDSDVHLCYGPGHQTMLQHAPHNHFDCRIESAGSLILEKLYTNPPEPQNPVRILYVTTGYYYNNLYVNCYPIPDNTLWSHQKTIVSALADANPPVDFKLLPDPSGTHFIEDYCRTHHIENISIIRTEKTFLELLDTAGIVICDYPSTPVIEAIAAHKTVFVLLDSPYLRDEALNLLKKRVYWSDDINIFVRMIADFLKGKPLDQKPDINNTEYLEMFGLSKLDGKVAERALRILEAETRTST